MSEEKRNDAEIICPIEISPIQCFAKAEQQDGKIRRIPVNDQRLAGMFLPKMIEKPEGFLQELDRKLYLESMGFGRGIEKEQHIFSNNGQVGIQTGTDIVRAKAKKDTDVRDVANFCITPKIRYVYLDRKGKEDREQEKIFCEIDFDHSQKEFFYISTKDISNICKIIKKNYAIARIDFEIKHVEKLIEDEFRAKIVQCKVVYRYFQQGWQMVNQRMIYVNQSARQFADVEYALKANLPLVKCDREFIGRAMLMTFSLYRDRASISTMVMFSFLGVLYRPFREAGFPPRFPLFLHGKTGSSKTTIAKILYTQLADDDLRDMPRRIDSDTVVSFERALIESGYDTVTLIDDYNPAKSKRKKEEMASKLETIVRLVGDMSTKSRSNIKLEDCRGEGVQGTVVLTGELRGKGLSSNLRCLYCKMVREKVNIDAVTWFQENPNMYTAVIYEFAEFVGANWGQIVSYIKNNFASMRKEVGEVLTERRLVDSVVTLHMVYHIILRFLSDYCKLEEREIMEVLGDVEEDIVRNAKMSQAISTEDSPSALFIKTINDLMRVGTIVFGTGKIAKQDIEKFDGFDDSEYFYFNPEAVFKKVRSFYLASNIDFAMDLREMIVALYDDGIIKAAPNGKGKQTYCVRIGVGDGKKQSFLKISKEIFRKVLDDSMDIVW